MMMREDEEGEEGYEVSAMLVGSDVMSWRHGVIQRKFCRRIGTMCSRFPFIRYIDYAIILHIE